MHPHNGNPADPQGVTPPGTGDEQLFSQLYHGDQPEQATVDDEEHRRRTAAIAGANTALGVSAATGSAAAGAVIATGQGAGVAGGAGAGGAAGGSGGAVASGIVKGGLATKFLIGGIAGAVVVSGVVVGVTVLNRDKIGNEAAPIQNAAADNGIEKYDFDNVAFTDENGTEFQLVDGRYQPPDLPADTEEGYHLTGTEYADVDGDNDLDAATMLEWHPNTGAVAYSTYLWLWDGGKAEQVEYPITTGFGGSMSDLKATKDGFEVAMTEVPALDSPLEPETITFGFEDGYPVQTKPVFGAVDRCQEHEGANVTGPIDGVVPTVAPFEDAPPLGEAGDFTVYSIDAIRALQYTGWSLIRAEHSDGTISCGWVPVDQL